MNLRKVPDSYKLTLNKQTIMYSYCVIVAGLNKLEEIQLLEISPTETYLISSFQW